MHADGLWYLACYYSETGSYIMISYINMFGFNHLQLFCLFSFTVTHQLKSTFEQLVISVKEQILPN